MGEQMWPRLAVSAIMVIAVCATAAARETGGQFDADKFFSRLSCRDSQISASQGNVGAIWDGSPQPEYRLRLFQLEAGSRPSAQPGELRMIVPDYPKSFGGPD